MDSAEAQEISGHVECPYIGTRAYKRSPVSTPLRNLQAWAAAIVFALGPRALTSRNVDHKAREDLFVDYAGNKLAIVDPESGAIQPAKTFLAILRTSELSSVRGQRHATT